MKIEDNYCIWKLPFGERERFDFLFVFPIGGKVSLGDGVHDPDVTLQSFGLQEIGEHLSHLLGFFFGGSLSGRGKDLVDGAGPPGVHQLVLVGEQELVASRPAEHRRLLPEYGGLEHLRRELTHPVEDEFLRVSLPSRRQEFVALSDYRIPDLPRRQVLRTEARPVPVKQDEQGEGDQRNEQQEERQVEMLHHHTSVCMSYAYLFFFPFFLFFGAGMVWSGFKGTIWVL